ncbi:MAG: Spy/CpxP family protein refolding chaperone [Nitrospinaceae bacterium]
MFKITPKRATVLALSFLLIIFFAPQSLAASIPGGTDSKGSYSYDADKKVGGSKSQSYSLGASSSAVGKREGSRSKGYGKKGHGAYKKQAEGSRSKGYAHGRSESYGHGRYKGSTGHGVWGHGGFHGSGGNPFKHALKFAHKLGLTEDQVRRIKDHSLEYQKMMIQAKADLAIAGLEMDQLVHAETVDENRIRAAAKAISTALSRITMGKADAKIAILKIMTPQQRRTMHRMHSAHN